MGMPMSDVWVGQVERVKRTFCQKDFDQFAALSGDDNPIHVDPEFSARTTFGGTVAHGMLLYGAVAGVLGSYLPGPGAVQIEQELMFPNPTYTGEEVTIQVEVTEVFASAGEADLATVIFRPDGNVGLQGRTRVRLPSTPSRIECCPDAPEAVEAAGASFKGLDIHQRAETRRVFTMEDLNQYAILAGDANPIFTDTDSARKQGLDGPVVPGSLLGGMFSYLLGTRLPGRGTNYLKQRLYFPAPAYADQELTASVEVIRLRPEKQLVNLRTQCTNPGGEVVCLGKALVLIKELQSDLW
jgi:acyl dehydratase